MYYWLLCRTVTIQSTVGGNRTLYQLLEVSKHLILINDKIEWSLVNTGHVIVQLKVALLHLFNEIFGEFLSTRVWYLLLRASVSTVSIVEWWNLRFQQLAEPSPDIFELQFRFIRFLSKNQQQNGASKLFLGWERCDELPSLTSDCLRCEKITSNVNFDFFCQDQNQFSVSGNPGYQLLYKQINILSNIIIVIVGTEY